MAGTPNPAIADQLRSANLGALICSLPKNVLMLSGYWPVVGTAVAIADDSGNVHLIIPEDEKAFASGSRAVETHTFRPGSLTSLRDAVENLRDPLDKVLLSLGAAGKRIGYEHGATSEPSSYSAMHLYGGSLPDLVRGLGSGMSPVPADSLIDQLLSIKDEEQVTAIRTSCELAGDAFAGAAQGLHAGVTELEAAARLKSRFASALSAFSRVQRGEIFLWAMSGTNSEKAHGAFAHSSSKKLNAGDLVLVHCNSYADGYATDITRTFSLGEVDDRRRPMYEAVFAARSEALAAIKPGATGQEVDHAARRVLEARGFGKGFKHSTGHGVGFGAISANALPRLHPKSPDVLRPGMVFNVEPAIYIEGYGGIRHCDMVAVTKTGYELLTPFQLSIDDLILK